MALGALVLQLPDAAIAVSEAPFLTLLSSKCKVEARAGGDKNSKGSGACAPLSLTNLLTRKAKASGSSSNFDCFSSSAARAYVELYGGFWDPDLYEVSFFASSSASAFGTCSLGASAEVTIKFLWRLNLPMAEVEFHRPGSRCRRSGDASSHVHLGSQRFTLRKCDDVAISRTLVAGETIEFRATIDAKGSEESWMVAVLYLQPVPESDTLLLGISALATLACLGAWRRRRGDDGWSYR